MNQVKAEIIKYISGLILLSMIIINFLFLILNDFNIPKDFFLWIMLPCFIFHPLAILDVNYISKKSKTNENIISKSWVKLPLNKKCFIVLYFVILLLTGLFYYLSSGSNSAHVEYLGTAFVFGIFYQGYYSIYSSRQIIIEEYGFNDDYKFFKSIIPPKEFLLGMLFTFIAIVVIGIILFIYISIKEHRI
ncbi:MAG: hypothetical protein BWY03_00615 [Parcubacteria group bacterium ADurb.Bin159]|nr:MAG: hypothetical protein BWY03_00615 [Parcubacteria group bacterium ADurb.Bin159]